MASNIKETVDAFNDLTHVELGSPPAAESLPKSLMEFSGVVCHNATTKASRNVGFVPILVISVAVALAQLLFDIFKYCKEKHGSEAASRRARLVLSHCAIHPNSFRSIRLKRMLRTSLPERSPIDEIFNHLVDEGITKVGTPEWNEIFS